MVFGFGSGEASISFLSISRSSGVLRSGNRLVASFPAKREYSFMMTALVLGVASPASGWKWRNSWMRV